MRWLLVAVGIVGGLATGWAATPRPAPAGAGTAADPRVVLGRAMADAKSNRHEAVLSTLAQLGDGDWGDVRPAALRLRAASRDALHLWSASEADLLDLAAGPDPDAGGTLDRLLDQWFFQERRAEVADLVAAVYRRVRSPRAAALLLLEAIRQESEQPAPAAVAEQLEPVRAREPNNGPAAAALGRMYLLSGRLREGADLLDEAVRLDPERPFVWERWLAAVADTGRFERLAAPPAPLPAAVAQGGRARWVQAQAAEAKGDAAAAERLYAEAVAAAPADRKLRFAHGQFLERAGRTAEAAAARAAAKRLDAAREELGRQFQKADPRRNGDALVDAAMARTLAEAYATLGHAGLADCWTREAGRRP